MKLYGNYKIASSQVILNFVLQMWIQKWNILTAYSFFLFFLFQQERMEKEMEIKRVREELLAQQAKQKDSPV